MSRSPSFWARVAAIAALCLLSSCGRGAAQGRPSPSPPAYATDPAGKTIVTRFPAPAGCQRVAAPEGSWAAWLRALPLKADGEAVRLWDGRVKANRVHAAVFDVPILREDLIQCADAVMKLRAEWLYAAGRFADISFTITNGMAVPFSEYVAGKRVSVKGSATEWVKTERKGTGRPVFDEWLRFIYAYAGTLSLSRELAPADMGDIRIGDCFIKGGSPGHVVLVVDLARDQATGKKAMLLAQSYMPAQEFHVLKRPGSPSPWYPVEDAALHTPEWSFGRGSLKRFR